MPTLPLLFGDVLDQPVDRVVRVGRLAGRLGVLEVGLRRQLECALRPESAAKILDDEDVAVARQLLQRAVGDAGRRSPARRTACAGTGSAAGRRAFAGVMITVSSRTPSRTGTITFDR